MTNNQLNRDINRLLKAVKTFRETDWNGDLELYAEQTRQEELLKKEFKRLYFADLEFEGMNCKSVLIMLKINLIFKFVPLHTFGINIDLENL